jgi:hypothetical protein
MHAHGLLFLISFAKKRPALSVLRGTQTRARARARVCVNHTIYDGIYMLTRNVGIKTTYVVQRCRRAKFQMSPLPYALFFPDMCSF